VSLKGGTVFMFAPNAVLIGMMMILDFELLLELDDHLFSWGIDCACTKLLFKMV
ncbi:unnamed protein product, partial [Sphenostylis stenocarpa]